MSESLNAEFEAYVKAELGDIAVVSEGRFISPKIQNYFKIWSFLEAIIFKLQLENESLKQVARFETDVAAQAIADFEAMKIEVEALRKDAEWIPKEGESVFVFSKYGQSDTADFIGGAWENCWLVDDADDTVTHWFGKPQSPPIEPPIAGEAT
jgi:hypothetical protein